MYFRIHSSLFKGAFVATSSPPSDGCKALIFDATEISPSAPDMPKRAKLCCVWREFAASPDAFAKEDLEYLQDIHREVIHDCLQ